MLTLFYCSFTQNLSVINVCLHQVKCLDAFTQQQTRLVIIVDGLDSCEQDKVLMVLDAVHMLFSEPNTPFIIILAIDPHIISKVPQQSLAFVWPPVAFAHLNDRP